MPPEFSILSVADLRSPMIWELRLVKIKPILLLNVVAAIYIIMGNLMLHEIRVLEIKANLEKNDFQVEEINWKERVTFQNEGNN